MGLFDFLGKKKEIVSPYTQRVPYKNQRYFGKYIQFQEECIERSLNNFKENKVHPDQIRFANGNILRYSLQKTIAMYSSGRPIEDVRNEYLKMIEFFEKSWDKEGFYDNLVWMVSLGILLEIEDTQFNKFVQLVDQERLEDYLVDYLITYRKPDRAIAATLFCPEPYIAIQETTKLAKPESEQRLKKYLEKEWYQSSNHCYWYNNHMSQYDTYFGYWSFESGAIAKIMALDDSSFKDNEYYPYDLVHWKESRKA